MSAQRTTILGFSLTLLLGACASGARPEPAPRMTVSADTIREEATPEVDYDRLAELPGRGPFSVVSIGRATPNRNREVLVLGTDSIVSGRQTRTADASPDREAVRREEVVRAAVPAPVETRERTPPTAPEPRAEVPERRETAEQDDEAIRTYQVDRGDTWLAIALRFGLTSDMLQRGNPAVTPDRIRIGQVLIIPERDSARGGGPAQRERELHEVQNGESLWSIARRYEVSIEELRDANRLTTDRIRPGQQLIIP